MEDIIEKIGKMIENIPINCFLKWAEEPIFNAVKMKDLEEQEQKMVLSALGSAFYNAAKYASGEPVHFECLAEKIIFYYFKQTIDEEGAKE